MDKLGLSVVEKFSGVFSRYCLYRNGLGEIRVGGVDLNI